MTARHLLRISGTDNHSFLQGLISNDIAKIDQGLVYAALLTPQGKYIADFFLKREGNDVLLDVADGLADGVKKRLNMYRLRADVEISESDLQVYRGTGPAPTGALADPRHPDLGWRLYGEKSGDDGSDWDEIRVTHCIPETGIELTGESYLLEAGFEGLQGVDFRKGCYVGQEVTARMKHKTELKKGLKTVKIDGAAPVGTEIKAEGKSVGRLFTQSGGRAIAYLRFDRAKGTLWADSARITWSPD